MAAHDNSYTTITYCEFKKTKKSYVWMGEEDLR